MNGYRNIFHRPVEGIEPGGEAELDLSEEAEAEYLRQGRLEILPRGYRVVGPRRVHETDPGNTFTAALPRGQERALVEGGHIERGGDEPARRSLEQLLELKRPELDEIAARAGIAEPKSLPNKQAVAAAIASR